MPVVQFAPFSSIVQPAFWHELTRLKLDVLRLSDARVSLHGSYSVGRTVRDRNTGADVELGCNFALGGDAFDEQHPSTPWAVKAEGHLYNYNTLEEFKSVDKKALFNTVAESIWTDALATADPSILTRFLLITYADLKKYRYYYWFAFPAFAAQPLWELDTAYNHEWVAASSAFSKPQLCMIHDKLATTHMPFFLLRAAGNIVEIAPLSEFDDFFADTPAHQRAIGFLDPSPSAQSPGWPLRNLLAYLRAAHPAAAHQLRVLCWRDTEIPHGAGAGWRSITAVVNGGQSDGQRPSAVGWEKNAQGKLGARMADLAPMMDPTRLADQAVDLNLKLMRWRILPALDLEKIAQTRCLLLGAGTLGCYVARALMGWGVRTITLVDSGRVSFSNPVRQPLFEFNDSLDGGRPKAECAADALRRIYPGVDANGASLAIPMPGHPIPPEEVESTKAAVERLEQLVEQHDAVFLLMDSRESRWLPSVLGAAKGKIILNAALGFDTFLVMRHGARTESPDGTRLGCYYCNDIVAPADSLSDRTLDQMCTVTRPGLAALASASAVELLVSLLQHPLGQHAPPPPANAAIEPGEEHNGVLGLVPHQLRGYLAQFRTLPVVGAAYSRCTACSETVLHAYEREGFSMLRRAFDEPGYLEQLTGLDKMKEETEAALEAVDWGEEEDDF
ncbi:unnamed protein product [Peniophora sp. CBMAI 1063]|nr:unnamed protein product [Peniophora sp. CBMAI 1063]